MDEFLDELWSCSIDQKVLAQMLAGRWYTALPHWSHSNLSNFSPSFMLAGAGANDS